MNHYPHIFSPVQVGNVILRNRMIHPNASPHFLQGPETFPAESYMAHYAAIARAGAAVVTIAEWDNYPGQRTPGIMPDFTHMQAFDLKDDSVQNYLCAMVEDVHYYGAKVLVSTRLSFPPGYSLHGGFHMGLDAIPMDLEAAPKEVIDEVIRNFVDKMRFYRDLGYDGVSLRLDEHISRGSRQRGDEYGGSVKNRTRFINEAMAALKSALGPDFIIEGVLHAEQPLGYYGGVKVGEGYEFSETLEYIPLLNGIVDILTIRDKDAAVAHPLSFNSAPGEHGTFRYAQRIREAGVVTDMLLAVCGGYQDPAEVEEALASGVCDMVSMGRAFIAEPEYEKKIREDRPEDINPCILCNRCHGNFKAPWISVCSVNPRLGNEHKLHRLVPPAGERKKVAVIGGGPAGMRAAICAAQRGHTVTLFEKTGWLGGQLIHAEHFTFKWALRRYRNWLVAQLDKNGVEVRLNTAPTPEEVEAMCFDAVLAATGARYNLPSSIEGLHDESGAPLYPTVEDVFSGRAELGHHVIMVGGSETAMETAMYLADNGHEVTVLTRQKELGIDASHLHYITMAHMVVGEDGVTRLVPIWEKYETISGILNVTTTEVKGGTVTYADGEGKVSTVTGDSVVICGGSSPRAAEAAAYAHCARIFYPIGDCNKAGNLWKCNRDAFSKANLI